MIKDNQQHFNRLHVLVDALVVAAAYLLAWTIQFKLLNHISGFVFQDYMLILIPLVPGYLALYAAFGMYTTKSVRRKRVELEKIVQANTLGLGIFMMAMFLLRWNTEFTTNFSRPMLFYFYAINIVLEAMARNSIRLALHQLRKKGFNQKHMILVGYSRAAEEYIDRIKGNPEWGYEIMGILDDNVEQDKLSDVSLPYMDFLENIRLLIGGASICILFLTVSRSIISREQFWRFLDALGMRRGQMYQIIFWEAVLFGAGAVIVGNLAGIGIYQLVIPAFEKITEQTLPQAIAWEGVLFGTGFSILCIAASYGLSAVQLRILLKEKKKKVQKRRGKYRKIVRFTPGRVLLHKWQMHRVRKSVEIVLLASALLIVGFGKMEISTRQEELKVYQRLTGNGYYLSTMDITNSPGISRQTVDKLEQVAGVTSVEQYHNNEKEEFWIDLSEYVESEYFQKVVETLVAYLNETSIKEKISIEKVRLSLLTIDRWQDIQRFLRNLDEGSLTKEEFEQGDFCILDLTELQEYDGKYLSAFSPDGQGISEDTVQVGEAIKSEAKRS